MNNEPGIAIEINLKERDVDSLRLIILNEAISASSCYNSYIATPTTVVDNKVEEVISYYKPNNL